MEHGVEISDIVLGGVPLEVRQFSGFAVAYKQCKNLACAFFPQIYADFPADVRRICVYLRGNLRKSAGNLRYGGGKAKFLPFFKFLKRIFGLYSFILSKMSQYPKAP